MAETGTTASTARGCSARSPCCGRANACCRWLPERCFACARPTRWRGSTCRISAPRRAMPTLGRRRGRFARPRHPSPDPPGLAAQRPPALALRLGRIVGGRDGSAAASSGSGTTVSAVGASPGSGASTGAGASAALAFAPRARAGFGAGLDRRFRSRFRRSFSHSFAALALVARLRGAGLAAASSDSGDHRFGRSLGHNLHAASAATTATGASVTAASPRPPRGLRVRFGFASLTGSATAEAAS